MMLTPGVSLCSPTPKECRGVQCSGPGYQTCLGRKPSLKSGTEQRDAKCMSAVKGGCWVFKWTGSGREPWRASAYGPG